MTKDKAATATQPEAPPVHNQDGVRELIETLAVAIILAFLVRTFLVEAFVIPTGSMAPTLLGMHKEVTCPQCQFGFQVGVSEEANGPMRKCFCPNCRFPITFLVEDILCQNKDAHYTVEVFPGADAETVYSCPKCGAPNNLPRPPRVTSPFDEQFCAPTYKGDRITVSKFPYMLGDLDRWDVAVFKYPNRARINFIKRVVGMPNEILRISHGDIYTSRDNGKSFQIERKPPDKVVAMLQPVFDNDHCLNQYASLGAPVRWLPEGPLAAGSWETSADGRTFTTTGKATETTMLRYSHLATEGDRDGHDRMWPILRDAYEKLTTRIAQQEVAAGDRVAGEQLRKQLRDDVRAHYKDQFAELKPSPVYDFCAYDADPGSIGPYYGERWVGDLALECELTIKSGTGTATIELIKGGRALQCQFEIPSGKATLSCDALPDWKPTVQTNIRGPGVYRIMLANVDAQLLLWIDTKPIEIKGSAYELAWSGPTDRDRRPAAVAVRGLAAELRHLRLMRDLCYTKHSRLDHNGRGAIEELDFPLAEQDYLSLGDNSPKSSDGRMWLVPDVKGEPEYYVRRELYVGKAMFVYWPHALDYIPGTSIYFPFTPNVKQMRFVH
ncbi:MAG: hypothetical protein JSS27_01620 [Planctomycetes bacterium]|nr:hypothetical protein [Planctomycetota bacterium]